MDLSDLPTSALKLIAEADIEAKYILRESETSALFSVHAPKLDGEQPGSEPDEFSEGRNRAARHLFGVTATQLWKRVQPDLDAFKARLNAAKKWVDGKFHPEPGVLNDAAANERKWARREVRSKRTVSEPPKILPRGALGAALMRRHQALKEGRLEGYLDLPLAAESPAPRGLSKVAYPSEKALVRLRSEESDSGAGKPLPGGQQTARENLEPASSKASGAIEPALTGVPARSPDGRRRGTRTKDLETSRKRIDMNDRLKTELSTVQQWRKSNRRSRSFDLATLKQAYPDFELWKHLPASEQPELLKDDLKPRVYAWSIVRRVFGLSGEISSREVLKKDRAKIRAAESTR
jgi:hypothetical protein